MSFLQCIGEEAQAARVSELEAELECKKEAQAARDELAEGRRDAAELYGKLNDALELEQTTLGKTQEELERKLK